MTNPPSQYIKHHYGPQVHLLNHAFLNGALAKLCAPETFQPEINHLVEILYQNLLQEVMNVEFAKENFSSETRMTALHPGQLISGDRLDPKQKVICVNIARAGTYPSHLCFEYLHYAIDHTDLRQDHIYAARTVDKENHVTGTEISATKIGGGKEGSLVLFPDPMAATGSTLVAAINHYKKHVPGHCKKTIALHLIVTPEYLRNILKSHPEVVIYGLRLDRGLSSQAVLDSVPGKNWDQEKGLNENGYIVPGGGGFGEIMNNSFV